MSQLTSLRYAVQFLRHFTLDSAEAVIFLSFFLKLTFQRSQVELGVMMKIHQSRGVQC